jgi:hypothetical protein
VTAPAAAQTITLNRDIDLVADNFLVHVSQTDGRWGLALVGPADEPRTKTIGECGCLLAAFSAAIQPLATGMLPWYVTPFRGGASALDFNPLYLDIFFNLGPSLSSSPGCGYKKGLTPWT